MFQSILHLMMGSVGRFISQLYSNYSFYINFFVLIYGMSLLWVHSNLRLVVQRMEKGILQVAKSDSAPSDFAGIARKFSQKWKEENRGKYFFIPSSKDLWFEKIEGNELVDLLMIGPDYVKMVLHKNLGVPERSAFPEHVYLAWEDYRHSMIRGFRKKFVSPKEIKQQLKKK